MNNPPLKKLVAVSSYNNVIIDKEIIKAVRRRNRNINDKVFVTISIISLILHLIFILIIRNKEIPPPPPKVIEEVPERFAKLIVEKPIPKEKVITKKEVIPEIETRKGESQIVKGEGRSITAPLIPQQKVAVRRSVEARVAKVEKKIRTVGVLGMLSGVGTTAKGPAVVDVLGALKDRKESNIDLEAALQNMKGLQKTKDIDILERKLVKSKDVAISSREGIDELLASVGEVKSVDLTKKGSIIIQKPESIEGAASSHSKRDNEAINAVVSSHKVSIRMSYEKFLKRDPSLSGKITIKFTIAANGSVVSVTVIENTTGSKELEEELVRKIRLWHFEEIPEGEVTVTYPFVFTTGG